MKERGGAFSVGDGGLTDFLGSDKETFFKNLPPTPCGIIVVDRDGTYLYVNPEFTKITGYTLEDVPNGREWLTRAFPDPTTRNKVMQYWKYDVKQKGVDRVFQIICKNGNPKLIHFRSFLLRDGKGITILSDVIEHKEPQENIWGIEEKLRDVFDDSKLGDLHTEDEGALSPVARPYPGSARGDEGYRDERGGTIPETEPGEKDAAEKVPVPGGGGAGAGMEPREEEREEARGEGAGDERPRTGEPAESPGSEPAMVVIEEDRLISMANREFELLSGYTREEIEGRKKFVDLVVPEDLKAFMEYQKLSMMRPDTPPRSYEVRLADRFGNRREIYVTLWSIPGTKRSMASIRDVTGRKVQLDVLARTGASVDEIIRDYAPVGIFIINSKGEVEYVNREMLRISGATKEQFVGLNVFSHPGYEKAGLLKNIRQGLQGGFFRMEAVEYTTFFGKRRAFRNFTGIAIEERGDRKLVLFVEDQTKQKLSDQQVAYQANHDLLTGLPNRHLFSERFKLAATSALQYDQKLAVMFMDLDHFKEVNHSLGFAAGDDLLRAVGDRVRRIMRQTDTIARMGGDEFLVLVQNIDQVRDAEIVARKIINSFQSTFVIDGHALDITCSIGVALFPDDGNTMITLVRCADLALNEAKKDGRNTYRLYSGGNSSRTGPA